MIILADTQFERTDLDVKLELLSMRHRELEQALADPEVYSDPVRYRGFAKEKSRLDEIVALYQRFCKVRSDIEQCKEILKTEADEDLRALAEEDLHGLESERDKLEMELKRALIPKDPNDEKDVIVEIRAGTGGEEAALFAGDLFRMYGRYAEEKGWKVEILSSNPTDLGGFKEVVFAIEGKGAYSRMKWEGGVHRVQRIPVTEAGGRIHTSTATVAVLPEAEEVDVQISPDEIRVDTYCASGHGGQGVNTTYSAVRVTHIPTGIVVTCQDERSQTQNRERAMRVLRSRLKALYEEQQNQELSTARRSQVGTGERAEKIRTYNFPQNRVTDHRVGYTSHRLQEVLDGDLDEIIDVLILEDEKKRLQKAE